jgi:hypothetical protein
MLIGRITAGMQIPLSADLSPFLGAVLTESTMSLFFAGITFQHPAQRSWLITRLLEIDRRTGWASAGMIARGCETSWEKAAEMGRGPPYERLTLRVGDEGTGEADKRGMGKGDGRARPYGAARDINEKMRGDDMRFVVKGALPSWALNLLGTEEDLRVGMERFGL